MTLHTWPDVVQGSDEWHDLRRGIPTASIVGRLLTPTLRVADNDTSRGIVQTLVAERITGTTEPTPMTGDMWRGVEMEPHARDAYTKQRAQADEYGFMLRDETTWRLGYSPDGVVGDDGLIEIKCPRAKNHITTVLADEIPAVYMPQLQAGLLVSGRAWIDFVSYVGGLPLFVKRVEPDPDWFAAITEACEAFEAAAAVMAGVYRQATDGLPATERIPDLLDLEF